MHNTPGFYSFTLIMAKKFLFLICLLLLCLALYHLRSEIFTIIEPHLPEPILSVINVFNDDPPHTTSSGSIFNPTPLGPPEFYDVDSDDEKMERIYLNPIFSPYYAQLEADDQKAYRYIFNAILKTSKKAQQTRSNHTVIINAPPQDKLSAIMTALGYDQPELFLFGNGYSSLRCSWQGENKDTCELIMGFNEYISPDILDTITSNAEKIITEGRKYKTAEERALYVHDVLARTVQYDYESLEGETAYSALYLHSSVCAGYADAYRYLMRELGVPTYYVSGIFKSSSPKMDPRMSDKHAWNIILIGNNFYNIDVTHDSNKPNPDMGYNHQIPEYRKFLFPDSRLPELGYRRIQGVEQNGKLIFTLPNADGTAYTFNNLFGAERVAQNYQNDFENFIPDVVKNLNDYNKVACDWLEQHTDDKGSYEYIVEGKSTKDAINDLSIKNILKNCKTPAHKNRKYQSYKRNHRSQEVADQIYLFKETYEFVRQ